MSNESAAKSGHVVLLGDSIFDNGAYVRPKPAVIDQLRAELPAGWKATLLAEDGSLAEDVSRQLAGLPADATHLIVSAGGNDALQASALFPQAAATVGDALYELSRLRRQFESDYVAMLRGVLTAGLPTVVCTIYDPNYEVRSEQQAAICGLAIFNDCITRAAARAGLPVIDLRLLFQGPHDYANAIEPSEAGGAKIVREIRTIVSDHDFSARRTVLYAGT
jgi:hypothetical protein